MIHFKSFKPNSEIKLNQDDLQKAISQAENSPFADFSLLEAPAKASKLRAKEIRDRFDQTVMVGIGGSFWTPSSLSSYFWEPGGHQLLFLDSPDSRSFQRTFQLVKDIKRTHFVFISKSGSTLEPLSLLSSLIEYSKSKSIALERQSTLICSPGDNPMRTWANQNDVPVLEIPTQIGGRFSALTPVGLLPSELIGLSSQELLDSAQSAKKDLDLIQTCIQFGLEGFESKLPITQMWAYSQDLWPIGQWWQQLWSESLAKKGGPMVSTPMVCSGPRDQHSLFQQLMDGERDKNVLLLQDESLNKKSIPVGESFSNREEFQRKNLSLSDVFQSEIEGFAGAVDQSGIPMLRLSGDFSKVSTWGGFFMLWQMSVAAMGFYLRVNPFDQPGVELGKVLARQYLKSMPNEES